MAVVLILRTTTETSNVSTDDLFGTSLDVYMRAAYVIDADSSGGGNRNDDKENVENLDVVDEPADLGPAAVLNDKLPTSKPANLDLAALCGSVACNDQA